jgi:ferredoxin
MRIFVYSGTGNTLKAAEEIQRSAAEKGVKSVIEPIEATVKPGEFIPDEHMLLGLMAPTLGAIQPASFFKFILMLPRGRNTSVFLASTGAWTKIGPFILRGFIGFGLYLAALILLVKGYRIIGIDGFGMPHNWTTLIPPYPSKLERRICDELRLKTDDFTEKILSGKHAYRRIGDLLVGILIFPLPITFLIGGRLFLSKTMMAGFRCNGCGECADRCPRQAIVMKGRAKKRPYWTFKCEQCMRCAGYCPRKAVEGSYLLMVLYGFILLSAGINAMLLRFFSNIPIPAAVLFIYIYQILVLWILYAFFHALNRIPVLNRFFTYASVTYFWRKYRSP